ncbi:MAG: GNAT family N-acetyltransferase [Alteromonadaceae bacterium]|uniref:GNAT family N-acetyltransferase n=1 Tax=unclassified Marinobacter TaxID=83889 RepID=UPI000C4BC6C9|nr:GNAT family N-acetyltransferase [Marinobacter sp. BGYM27]MAA64041.1 GNAT family N-acetyltransferase [Alteromonadaceae bacterium]MBH85815.1 GNAT family N-acetyltransferase [Alteromonadaceae bacterium]MDG5500285.1 GNAT family N-acetyltransferase [Marinobacter sp. BGYM27]|tara:strand:- start:17191 stop:17832 length:642 start_codon:yes stop_codon:yes gene_type:complete
MTDVKAAQANVEPVVVRLDSNALNEAKSILYQAYRHEPTFHYLFDHQRPGYDQRVRATIRELISLYFDLDQDAIGLMLNDTLVAVAFLGDPELRLDLARQFSWRLRMILTAGFSSTRRYIDYHEQIRAKLPGSTVHQLPLMGVHPKYQNRGYGRVLLEAVERLCEDNPRGQGLVLDTGNSRYLQFYESLGFRNLGDIQLGDLREYILYRDVAA